LNLPPEVNPVPAQEDPVLPDVPRWLAWAREIQALSQTGLHYAENNYQRQRYLRLAEIAVEMLHTGSGVDQAALQEGFAVQRGYATPKVDVRGAVFQDGCLLMVRERLDGRWTLPGGWADVGNVPSEAAEREVLEEAGFIVKARKLVGVYDNNRLLPLEVFHAFKLVFLCEILGGTPSPSDETSEVCFFARSEIPEQLSGERTLPRHIQDAFAALGDPDCPTVFD
jgi:ADP-ribose pyrophosphatase YjhB (NUDIX family)